MCMAYILSRRTFLVGNPFTTDSSLGRGMHTVMWNLSLYAKTLCVSWSLVTHVPIERGSPSKRVCVNCNAKGSDLNDTDNDSYQLIFYEIWRLSLCIIMAFIMKYFFLPLLILPTSFCLLPLILILIIIIIIIIIITFYSSIFERFFSVDE
ncbi:hypothetical protein DFP73DRAFT_262566 [Morchella snyderi]|nr:hypothetical protein DFP73DRAFT_262566 [Morchella snyderi]